MKISERYRDLVAEVAGLQKALQASEQDLPEKVRNVAGSAAATLEEYREQVGEIPRIQLEDRLTPVLLRGHSQLDRTRLMLEEQGHPLASRVWELEQTIYRLLNDL